MVLLVPLTSVAQAQTGPIVGWGYNSDGHAHPPVESQDYEYRAVAAGFEHSVAIRADGSLVAWGSNQFGQTTRPSILSTRNVGAISAGYYHSLAIIHNPGQSDDGHVVAWGDNSEGGVQRAVIARCSDSDRGGRALERGDPGVRWTDYALDFRTNLRRQRPMHGSMRLWPLEPNRNRTARQRECGLCRSIRYWSLGTGAASRWYLACLGRRRRVSGHARVPRVGFILLRRSQAWRRDPTKSARQRRVRRLGSWVVRPNFHRRCLFWRVHSKQLSPIE
ncbi:MAG: hypothetical protein JNM80_04550 [Phycisphaerae bacterium]|nr:hypothetical protein [Phycisphaerae bacterium]